MAKVSRPVLYMLVLAAGVSAYTTMGGPGKKSGSNLKPLNRVSKKQKAELFTKEDYSAHFARLDKGVKDSFTPLVARSGSQDLMGPDVVPVDFAAGDPNWVFTGTSEIDGHASALLENKVSFESEFVPLGQRWKNCTVHQIEEGKITLIGRTGRRVELRLIDEFQQMASAGGAGGNQPVNPALSGPIGRGVAIRPEGTGASAQSRSTQEPTNAN
ncbi:MAG: hypothetical protein HZC36_04470 [Armatimonadetes bacterium]|nr:hypothetical protein [Armatimonadota bacterium]